ncbi:MAG: ferritin family protein [Deltaproteobacteria bacterium]|nr:ferritin family protein [Deltaproteobacteria bacterium]
MKSEDFDAVIERAIANEEEANKFYLELAGIVTDKSTKDTLRYLADEEMNHKNYLLRYRKEGFFAKATKMDEATNYKIAELVKPPAIKSDMDSKDVYLLAAARELNSYNFYMGMAAIHPDGEIKDMLLKMANEELKHKEKVEYLYSNTAFVQTAGG